MFFIKTDMGKTMIEYFTMKNTFVRKYKKIDYKIS